MRYLLSLIPTWRVEFNEHIYRYILNGNHIIKGKHMMIFLFLVADVNDNIIGMNICSATLCTRLKQGWHKCRVILKARKIREKLPNETDNKNQNAHIY